MNNHRGTNALTTLTTSIAARCEIVGLWEFPETTFNTYAIP
jgi:hypothetical protein